MNKNKKLIIFGDSSFAEIAYEYFTHDSEYEVSAFSIEKDYIQRKELFSLPIVPFENIEKIYQPSEYYLFVALVYNKLNKFRERIYDLAKAKGYQMASYISSKSFVWHNVVIGDNCFIFEDNTIQPFVKIGNNTILWSGNHIGHHSVIGNHNFISSHVVISGHCTIGDYCFFGVNTSINNNLTIANETVTGSGTVIIKDTEENSVYVGNPARKLDKTAKDLYGV